MSFADDILTCDRFLNGKLEILQPKQGHRAGIDPVLLAASVDAVPGQSILELGCGAGVASLCLGRRVRGLTLTGVELQPDYAELAQRNADDNDITMLVVTADLVDLPVSIRQKNFDHVFANPPYYQRSSGTAAADRGREAALAGDTPLIDWIDVATRRVRPLGHVTIIQKADRLRDLLTAMDKRLGSIVVTPIAPRIGRAAELVIVRAKKGGRGAFRLMAPVILHQGARHERDGDSYTAQIRDVLREGGALEIG
ncbi:MAG: tRNA1(Val) (adenine(37)-N6)-methyltransferase [Paracoccaceae bacterium]